MGAASARLLTAPHRGGDGNTKLLTRVSRVLGGIRCLRKSHGAAVPPSLLPQVAQLRGSVDGTPAHSGVHASSPHEPEFKRRVLLAGGRFLKVRVGRPASHCAYGGWVCVKCG